MKNFLRHALAEVFVFNPTLTPSSFCAIIYAMEAVGSSDSRNYTVVPRIMGNEMCCLESVMADYTQRYGEFIVPDRIERNCRSIYYKVVKAGSDVEDITGVKEGDYVFVDALARFADTHPISFINCRNILFMTDKTGSDIRARKYRVIAKIVEPSSEKDSSGFIRVSGIDPYAEIVSIGDGCEDRGYKVGDRVSVSSNADMYMMNNVKYFDYDFRVPMFRFEKEA